MGDWNVAPQQLLASVTEGVQRFTKQLQPRQLDFKSPQATQTNASKRPVSHRAPVVGFKSHQMVVDGEGVLTPLQVSAFPGQTWLTWSPTPFLLVPQTIVSEVSCFHITCLLRYVRIPAGAQQRPPGGDHAWRCSSGQAWKAGQQAEGSSPSAEGGRLVPYGCDLQQCWHAAAMTNTAVRAHR